MHERESATPPPRLEVFGNGFLGAIELSNHLGADGARNVQIGAREIVEPGERCDPRLVARHGERHLSGVGGLEHAGNRGGVRDLLIGHGRDQRLALGINEVGDRKVAQSGLSDQEGLQLRGIGAQAGGRIVQILGHVDRIGADHRAVLLEIGVHDVQRGIDDHPGACRHAIERSGERGRGRYRQQDSRQGCDDCEQTDDANVQPCPGLLVAPGSPEPRHIPGDDGDHRQDQQQVHEQKTADHVVTRHDRRQPRQNHLGDE